MKLKEIVAKYESHEAFLLTVATKVLQLADAQPDFQYVPDNGCRCSYNGPAIKNKFRDKPEYGPDCKGCILGQALQQLEWDDVSELRSGSVLTELLEAKTNLIRNETMYKLQSAQTAQDKGIAWKNAVSELRDYITSLSANAPATGESNV